MCLHSWSRSYVDIFGNDRLIELPCGKCVECVKAKQDSYKIRLIEHSKDYAHCYFFTLTYRDSALPYNVITDYGDVIGVVRGARVKEINDTFVCLSSARVKDIQDWLKRFRTSYARAAGAKLGYTAKESTGVYFKDLRPDFSYFLCAEYGPNGSRRPHYHGIIFSDLPKKEFNSLFADWSKRYGFVKWKEIKQRVDSVNKCSAPANYVGKYCCKGEFASRADDIANHFIEPAFILQSKGIGAGYITRKSDFHLPKYIDGVKFNPTLKKHVDYVVDHLYYLDGAFRYKLPRYFYSKLFLDKTPKLVEFYHPKKRRYVVKSSFQYCANYLSCKMSLELQRRAEERDKKSLVVLSRQVEGKSFEEKMVFINRLKKNRLLARYETKSRKLSEFYNNNKLKFSKL